MSVFTDEILRRLRLRCPDVSWSIEKVKVSADGKPAARTVVVGKYGDEEVGAALGEGKDIDIIVETIAINVAGRLRE